MADLNARIADLDREIAQLLAEHDNPLADLQGAGTNLAATIRSGLRSICRPVGCGRAGGRAANRLCDAFADRASSHTRLRARRGLQMTEQHGDHHLERLEVFVGEWSMQALFPADSQIDATAATGAARTVWEWLPGRQFLVQPWEVPHPAAPDGIAVIGLDRSRGIADGGLLLIGRLAREALVACAHRCRRPIVALCLGVCPRPAGSAPGSHSSAQCSNPSGMLRGVLDLL